MSAQILQTLKLVPALIFILASSKFVSGTSTIINTRSTTQYKFQVPKSNPNLSILDVAIQIANFASTSVNPEPFICGTWIFSADSLENGQQEISNTFSSTTIEHLYPIVVISTPTKNDEEELVTINNYAVAVNNTFANNKTKRFTYTNYEFSLNDIIRPQHLGVMRKSINCMSIFINGDNGESNYLLAITNKLVEKKLARPHRDYFFYIIGLNQQQQQHQQRPHQKSQEALLELILSNNKALNETRYKFVLDFTSSSKETNTNEMTMITADFYNICERKGEKLPLFSKTCNSHIVNRHYKATSTYIAPMVRYENHADGSRKWGSGMIFLMFLEASKRYNFTFDINYAGFSGSSGFRTKEGKWFGAVGEVYKREADIAFSVGIVAYRHHIVDPSMTQTWITRTFFIKSPSFKTSWGSVFWPMELHIWILTIITIIIVLPVYYWTALLYFKTAKSAAIKPPHLLTEVIDVLNRILMEQSATARPWKGNRIRLLILLWTGFCLVIETGYRSKLVTFLTFLEREEIPKTHMELSKSNYKLFFRTYNGVAYQYTAASPDPMHKRILAKSTLSNHSHECIHLALLTEKSACLDYRLNGQFAIETNATLFMSQKSEIVIVSKDNDFATNIVWGFRKGSPWTASFDKILLNTLAAGLYNKFKDDDWTESRLHGSQYLRNLKESVIRDKIQSVITDMNIGPKALNRGSLEGTYIIFFIGILASFIGWIGEHIVFLNEKYRIQQKNRRQIQSLKIDVYSN